MDPHNFLAHARFRKNALTQHKIFYRTEKSVAHFYASTKFSSARALEGF